MKNFPVHVDGKEYWVARNVAVVGFVIAPRNGKWCILANKRGEGVPDYKGYWNAPCGYLDFDETIEQAVLREVFEETGVQLHSATFWGFSDSPLDNHQNITFRYYTILPNAEDLQDFDENNGGENGEVADIAWIPVDCIDQYQWAFKHDELIKELSNLIEL